MRRLSKTYVLGSVIVVFSIMASVVVKATSIWVEPTTTPPGNNVAAPINTSSTAQTKIGDLFSYGKIGGVNLCINSDCRAEWPAGISAQNCPSGQAVTGIDATGNIICSGSGLTISFPCNQTLPTGAKKIFVTSSTYNTYDVPNESTADAKCQAAANAVGYSGTYKALVYMGNRNPSSVIPSGQTFWNGQKNGADCNWIEVAANAADFFTDNGDGNYLQNPILYNEQGLAMNGVTVFTNIMPQGGGNFYLPNQYMYNSGGISCYQSSSGYYFGWGGACFYYRMNYTNGTCQNMCGAQWYGFASAKTTQWAYNIANWGGCNSLNNCQPVSRAFYCIEQ